MSFETAFRNCIPINGKITTLLSSGDGFRYSLPVEISLLKADVDLITKSYYDMISDISSDRKIE